ncbi:hypothetical protein FA13DRAFT_1724351 [Coprinellus micaceus]|uniref:Uncharacterized protein n=1 Tax=Coprinellus micaceus TaxID=71717 RepID=A0A4Y7U115_COPMI|nr:hypothetical protein FA13DRAFT_1724351 [Coprinellus micaceus]
MKLFLLERNTIFLEARPSTTAAREGKRDRSPHIHCSKAREDCPKSFGAERNTFT